MSPADSAAKRPGVLVDFSATAGWHPNELDVLGALVLTTALAVFVLGNLLLWNVEVLRDSSPIGAVCLGIVLTIVALVRLTGSIGWALAGTYAFLAVAAFDDSLLSRLLFLTLCAAAVAFTYRLPRAQSWTRIGAAACIATFAILGCYPSYTSFDMLQRLRAGNVLQDTLFHASIAAMLKNYGETSTGLNGLVPTPYHVFSHVLMASISRLSGRGVLEVYGVAPWVLFAPVLFLSFCGACVVLQGGNKRANIPILWIGISALLALVPFFMSRWALWNHFLISESYLVSLGLLLAGIPLLYKKPWSVPDWILVVVLATMMAGAKATVGLVFVGLLFVRALLWGFEAAAAVAAVCAAVCVVVVVRSSAAANAGTISIMPFDFVRASSLGRYVERVDLAVSSGHWPSPTVATLACLAVLGFLVMHFSASWVAVIASARRTGLKHLLAAPLAAYSLASAAAGIAVAALFAIPGGSAYYVTSIAFFVAAPALVLMATDRLSERLPAHLPWALAFGLTSLASAQGLYAGSAAARGAQAETSVGSEFVRTLMDVREHAPRKAVLLATASLLDKNPIRRCLARPLVYPAVTEHPWIDVIEPLPKRVCDYDSFTGFSQYGLAGDNQRVVGAPVLPPGAIVERVK